MKNTKKTLILSFAMIGSITLTSCDLFKKKSNIPFSFSIALESGASIIEKGSKERVVPYNNGEDVDGRSYTFGSTNTSVATIDSKGYINAKAEGRVNFYAIEKKSNKRRYLKKEVVVVPKTSTATGGFNESGGTTAPELAKRAEILGKLEKYAMDTHLTGITLFDNGGYVEYSDRVTIPTANGNTYITGYGFGVLSDGELNGTLSGANGKTYKTYYHTSVSQDSLKINMYSATGSQVSDLASYISSSYWGTRLVQPEADNYEWAPMLAAKQIRRPIINSETGEVTGYESTLSDNNDPIPMEKTNTSLLYKKWRVYVKVDSPSTPLKFTKFKQNPENISAEGIVDEYWNERGVQLEDYLFPYKLLLTGSTGLIRGSEMANDSSYGIKGAQRYFNATQKALTTKAIDDAWKEYYDSGKLGLHVDVDDVNQPYIDIELINPIDVFTAKYTLSSNLVSPLPESFFVGPKAISATESKDGTLVSSAEKYGVFNKGGKDNAILNYTICLGPYTLAKWVKNSEIVFATNTGTSTESKIPSSNVRWFECDDGRYKIPGVYYRAINTDSDSEKVWKQFKDAHNLDSAGVPTSQVKTEKGRALQTEGDSTFKLNVNSCTEKQWKKMFGEGGSVTTAKHSWTIKPWMSNHEFLDGLFYSIDRKSFAEKRGVTPSVNYFSDAYQMRNSEGGDSYNKTEAHKEAVKGYAENFGYSKDKAIDCFRNAVQQLAADHAIVLGSKEKPTEIKIHIRWMYQNDIKEYGDDIVSYFETAFNNDAVCGGRVKLKVEQEAVQNWEDVYNEWMMQGCFDLAFGAISGNTYNPLNFMEVLKSDNSSGFTLNWGPDTSVIDEHNPIIYNGKKWSFDALWEVADHGGIVNKGVKEKPYKKCKAMTPQVLEGSGDEYDLYKGFKMTLEVDFAESDTAVFDVNRLDIYIFGKGNTALAENTHNPATSPIVYNKDQKVIEVTVDKTTAEYVDRLIREANDFYEPDDPDPTHKNEHAWQDHPFILDKLKVGSNGLFAWELYYELTIGNLTSISYAEVN